MISILIPTYNYNVYSLVETLHGQLKELEIDFEILVYDDGSPKIIADNNRLITFPNTIYKKFEQNKGRTAIRSSLANDAQFEWLLFLDADVLPEKSTFLGSYIQVIEKTDFNVIVGGVIYEKDKPSKEQMLRWKYGHLRETKSVEIRKKDPFTIVSSNLCIKKSIFLKANTETNHSYGLDNFFSNQLKKMNAKVKHIDNPVFHLGLEENDQFLKKALNAVNTTVVLEQKGIMDSDMRPIQKSYLKLKRLHLEEIFSAIISSLKSKMEANFNSENPNLFWFDLYRLNYYIQLKKKHNA